MRAKALAAAFAAAVPVAVVAKEYVDYYRPFGVPGESDVRSYLESRLASFGLPGLAGAIDEAWIESDGLRLHLDIFPAGETDPALVFVPGTSVYALLYAEFMHRMSLLGFNVIGLDPRGHGRSEGRRGSYTVGELVRDARAATDFAFERFGRSVAICGSSQGGIAAFYSAASDERLSAAVCHNVAVLDEPEILSVTRFPLVSSLALRLLPLVRFVPELRVPVTAYLDLKAEPTPFGQNALEFLKEDPLAVLSVAVKALASLVTAPPPRPVEEIRVPVMVVQAEFDIIFGVEYSMRLYDRLTCDKEFMLVGGAPHLVMTNEVGKIVAEIAAWLNERM